MNSLFKRVLSRPLCIVNLHYVKSFQEIFMKPCRIMGCCFEKNRFDFGVDLPTTVVDCHSRHFRFLIHGIGIVTRSIVYTLVCANRPTRPTKRITTAALVNFTQFSDYTYVYFTPPTQRTQDCLVLSLPVV